MSLESLYKEVIMEHHQHPRGRAPLETVSGSAHGYNASCGDDYTVNIHVENGRVAGIQIEGQGCAISSAAGSMLGEIAVGMSIDQLKQTIELYRDMLKTGQVSSPLPGDLEALAGVNKFPVRIKCASLPMTTALDAVHEFEHGK